MNSDQNAYVSSQTSGEVWLGYSEAAQEGTWEWISGCNSTYENWDDGEPNNYGGDEDYAVISESYGDGEQWHDWGMGTDNNLCVCQSKGERSSPTSSIHHHLWVARLEYIPNGI